MQYDDEVNIKVTPSHLEAQLWLTGFVLKTLEITSSWSRSDMMELQRAGRHASVKVKANQSQKYCLQLYCALYILHMMVNFDSYDLLYFKLVHYKPRFHCYTSCYSGWILNGSVAQSRYQTISAPPDNLYYIYNIYLWTSFDLVPIVVPFQNKGSHLFNFTAVSCS